MPAKELGTKHTCFKCAARFYDLKKPVPICPRCGADQREAQVSKPAPERKQRAPAKPVEPIVDEADAEELDEELDADEDDAGADDDA